MPAQHIDDLQSHIDVLEEFDSHLTSLIRYIEIAGYVTLTIMMVSIGLKYI